ncbi:MAG TPA: phosphatase PAP2 family protein [Gemmatimonadales bacterium]|nr:phosphatase PAP2 family protein [Gemmatimonadales bacterium]
MPVIDEGTAAHGVRPLEWLMGGYAALVAAVVAVRAPELHGWQWLLLAHGLILLLIWLLNRPGLGRTGRIIREIFPLLLLLGLYAELDVLNAGNPRIYDDLVQRWESAIFGGQPSRDWWRAYPDAFWSFVLHGAYLAYYAILAFPPVWLAARGNTEGIRRFLLMVMTAFVVCYVFFIFMPVAGPYYMFPRPEGPFVDNVMARLVYGALEEGSSYGAAFPSSHVAATVAALFASWRADRTLGWILVLPTILLIVSVVYCQMHYAVDALAGLGIGIGIGAAAIGGRR